MNDTKRVAMITGANRGLGLAASRALARDGMTVVMGGRDRQALDEAVEALSEEGTCVVLLLRVYSGSPESREGAGVVDS